MMDKAEAGRLGGKATVARHGRRHMSQIGKRGFETTVARHWQGDRATYREWLLARAWNVVIDALTDAKIDAALAAGATTVCVEIPLVESEDEIPW
jgi:hypothetical protein